jgi:hypothetical protein
MGRTMTRILLRAVVFPVLLMGNAALAGEPPSLRPAAAAPATRSSLTARPTEIAPPRWPYASPFQLRNVMPRTGVRVDATLAPYTYRGADALETVVFLSGQVRVADKFSLQARWGVDDNRVTGGQNNRTGILNPSVGALFGTPIGSVFRFAVSTAISLPLATGGGRNPDPDAVLLQRQGALARSSMDNASFAVNDLGFPTGVSLAYIQHGFTAQVDFTIIASGRVKGETSVTDSTKMNSTYGLFFGYFVLPELLSLGLELRYQYYLTPTEAVLRDPNARANLTLATGARLNFELSGSTRIRPGLCFGTGLLGPVYAESVRMVQLDIPVSF